MDMRSLLSSKKGQINSMGPAVITMVIAAVFLILGIVMLQSIRDTDLVKEAISSTVSNETLTTVTEQGDLVATSTAPGFANFNISVVTNRSSGAILATNNYTYTQAGLFSVVGTVLNNNTNWNVSYTYTQGDQAYIQGNATLAGLATFADFWEIIVLAVVISVVIGLLLIVFGGRRDR